MYVYYQYFCLFGSDVYVKWKAIVEFLKGKHLIYTFVPNPDWNFRFLPLVSMGLSNKSAYLLSEAGQMYGQLDPAHLLPVKTYQENTEFI